MQVCLSMYDLLMDTRRSEVKTKIIAEHALHFSKCDQIRSFLQIWSHLPKKSPTKDFSFCAVWVKKLTVWDDCVLLWPYNNLWTRRKFYIWSFNQVKLPWSEWKSFHSKIEALHKKCPYPELFWSAFCPHFPATGLNTERYSISLQNADQSNSENGHFLHSEDWSQFV